MVSVIPVIFGLTKNGNKPPDESLQIETKRREASGYWESVLNPTVFRSFKAVVGEGENL